MDSRTSPTPGYQVPALEKGLDILECLALQSQPLTQVQISRELGRGTNELFRMLVSLERRGYIQRDVVSGAYSLTLRLFELSHIHSPFQYLVNAASQPMRKLAEQVHESCHLSMLHRGSVLVLSQEESPRMLRLSSEIGSRFSATRTPAGRVLLAHLPADSCAALLADDADFASRAAPHQTQFLEQLEDIRACGFDEAVSDTIDGVRSIAVLVGSPTGVIQAALTIPTLCGSKNQPRTDLLPALHLCASEIAQAAGLHPYFTENELEHGR